MISTRFFLKAKFGNLLNPIDECNDSGEHARFITGTISVSIANDSDLKRDIIFEYDQRATAITLHFQ